MPTVFYNQPYENAPVAGVPREVFTASFLLNGTQQELKLPLEAIDLLVEKIVV